MRQTFRTGLILFNLSIVKLDERLFMDLVETSTREKRTSKEGRFTPLPPLQLPQSSELANQRRQTALPYLRFVQALLDLRSQNTNAILSTT